MGLRWMTAGESHGPGLVGIIAGLPAGFEISIEGIDGELHIRQQGVGRSKRQEIESDRAKIIAGIRHGKTIGSPIAILIENKDHENWRDAMSPYPAEADADNQNPTMPRPGHADLAGMLKWGFDDARNVLERASGRSTAMTVAIGTICRQYLQDFGIFIGSRIINFGMQPLLDCNEPGLPTREQIGDNPASLLSYRNLSSRQTSILEKVVADARKEGDTVGGVVQIIAAHVPPGLGSCALGDERLDSRLAAAVMGVPGIKAVEIGGGIDQAQMGGKKAHDQFAITGDPSRKPWYGRETNLAGGIEGGISNGEPVCITAWMKPLTTINPPNPSIDRRTRQSAEPEISERSDVAAVESVACVLEAAVALELARAHLEKFAGDSIGEVREAVERYLAIIE